MKLALLLIVPLLLACSAEPDAGPPPVATFSIVAYDHATGDLGVAVQSKFFGVGSVVPFAKADVGAVATQAWANTTYGPVGLRLMERGVAPERVIEVLTGRDTGRERRQVGMVDAAGRAASFTGQNTLAWAGHVVGEGFACQGNILAGEAVVQAMAKAFREGAGPLPERLVAALRAGQAAGGDKRGRQSAALLVVRRGGGYSGFNDRYVDIRVEDHVTPIEELARLLAIHRKFFPNVPVPGDRERYVMEPAPNGGPFATPRASLETWIARFRAGDLEGLYAAHTKAYRAAIPYEEFAREITANREAIESYLKTTTYAGTRRDGNRAKVLLRSPASARPQVMALTLEEGEWRHEE